jgi:hypothetical protein
MRTKLTHTVLAAALLLAWPAALPAGDAATPASKAPIDRHALVTRHNVTLDRADSDTALQVGNGEFAFGVDVTGLQTLYGNSLSQWGWHSFPLPPGKTPADLKLTPYDTYGRSVGYATSAKGQEAIYTWLRENPHRLNLGRLGLRLDNKPVAAAAITHIRQQLDLWSGCITSRYELDGQPVTVVTCCDSARDSVAVRITSPLLASGRLAIELAFPYGDPHSTAADWSQPDAHRTTLQTAGPNRADFLRSLDADRYAASLAWTGAAELKETAPHTFVLTAASDAAAIDLVCAFYPKPDPAALPSFAAVQAASTAHWADFWNSGGAVDLSASKDPRWRELERRIVLSQYLLAANEAGSLPPQESGLFNNGWYGKFHLEMHWWHAAHYALWDRWPLFQRNLDWYRRILPSARLRAESQGYRGARWPKMVGPEGRDSPSGVGPLLIWQQPHTIFFAELDYRLHPTPATLEKWRGVVFESAEFMASFAVRDAASGKYMLGPPLRTVPEKNDPRTTVNPTFELSYWRFGLRTAQQWRKRLGLAPDATWEKVLQGLAPLPTAEGVYLLQHGLTDTYTTKNWEHPSLIGICGMLPGDGVDPVTMRATVRRVMACWQWDRCWGWDFPMMAMAAARNGEPALAIDALMHPSKKNRFNEVGLSAGGPFPYFPSNGGLLYAVALMAAGWDGAPDRPAPGFPNDGSWVVTWEGLKRAP